MTIRSVESVQSDISKIEQSIAATTEAIATTDTAIEVAEKAPIPKTLDTASALSTFLLEHTAHVANLAAAKQSHLSASETAQGELAKLQAELIKAEAEEARKAALATAWTAYDKQVKELGSTAAEIYRLGDHNKIEILALMFRRDGKQSLHPSVRDLAVNPSIFEGVN